MKKILAFNSSPRKNGNTFSMLSTVLENLSEYKTEIIQIGANVFRGCMACNKCQENKNNRCIIDDEMNYYIEKIREADVLLLGSPTYFADITPELKALIDRVGRVSRANGSFLKHKIGAALVAARRAGSIHAFDSINHFFLISEMFVVGSTYWNMTVARNLGEYFNDQEGIDNMKNLSQNIKFLLDKI